MVEPFHPGTFEEYDLLENGLVKFVRSGRFHEPGQRPSFVPFVPWKGSFIFFFELKMSVECCITFSCRSE